MWICLHSWWVERMVVFMLFSIFLHAWSRYQYKKENIFSKNELSIGKRDWECKEKVRIKIEQKKKWRESPNSDKSRSSDIRALVKHTEVTTRRNSCKTSRQVPLRSKAGWRWRGSSDSAQAGAHLWRRWSSREPWACLRWPPAGSPPLARRFASSRSH